MHVAREAGTVRKIRIQKVPTGPEADKLENILTLDRSQCMKLIDLIKALDSIPLDGNDSVRVDGQVLRDVFSDPDAIGRVYSQDPARFRALIECDATAEDVIALQRRREVVETMRRWLENETAFDAARITQGAPSTLGRRFWRMWLPPVYLRMVAATGGAIGGGVSSQQPTHEVTSLQQQRNC